MEPTVDIIVYENSPNGQVTQSPDRRRDRHRKEYRLYRLVAVSFGILCVLQVILNISLRLNRTSCPERWLSFGSSCYYISASHMNWTESRKKCREQDAELLIISSQEEQNFVKALSVRAWIGLSYDKEAGVWRWVDGTPLTTDYWLPGEPNGGPVDEGGWGDREDCAETWPSRSKTSLKTWNDQSCGHTSQWICKRAR